jgi:capsular exopolysaccharide synthesis family protein
MSRIHEALKRATLERAAAQVAEGNRAPEAPPIADVQKGPNSPAMASQPTIPTPPANGANGHIKLEDLQARRGTHAKWNPDPNSDVFSSGQSSHGAEQIRMLRSRLYHVQGTRKLRTLTVTSSLATEGKTFVTANLARAIARQADRRVLVMDGDLRCPRLHTLLGAPLKPGLSDYLQGKTDELSIIQHGGSGPGNLFFIPSGNTVTDQSELLSNGRLKILLDRLAPLFDWVLIDAPPCLPVADAGLIANACDGLLFVVKAGMTPSSVILRSRQELKGRNVVGVVLNAVDGSQIYSSYYGYGSGYGTSEKRASK